MHETAVEQVKEDVTLPDPKATEAPTEPESSKATPASPVDAVDPEQQAPAADPAGTSKAEVGASDVEQSEAKEEVKEEVPAEATETHPKSFKQSPWRLLPCSRRLVGERFCHCDFGLRFTQYDLSTLTLPVGHCECLVFEKA